MSRDTSFYYSFLVLPARKRSAIIAVWDFCRAVDDAVDEVADDGVRPSGTSPAEWRARAAERTALLRAELDRCFERARASSGRPPETAQGRALVPYIREFNLPRAPFDDLIDGVEMDLEWARYPTFEALAGYCRRVASSVGLICVEIFQCRDPAARDYAVSLGMALQLTNIVRDIAADLRRGRIYIPAEDLARFGVAEDDLRAGRMTPAVRSLLRFECERARVYYRTAAMQMPEVDARNLLAAEIMGAIYFEILRRIERADYDVFSRRLRVPRPRRALIALRIWITRMFLGAPSQRSMPDAVKGPESHGPRR